MLKKKKKLEENSYIDTKQQIALILALGRQYEINGTI